MEPISKSGGRLDSVTPSTRLLNQRLGTLSGPRKLLPSEIVLLRQSKQEIQQMLDEVQREDSASKEG